MLKHKKIHRMQSLGDKKVKEKHRVLKRGNTVDSGGPMRDARMRFNYRRYALKWRNPARKKCPKT
jgi:hypothetical protein